MALSNGCICCSIGDDLTAALIRVLDTQPPYDAIVVEASGVSDPWRIAQLALADPALELGGVVVLVDAAAAPTQSKDPRLADTLARQLAAADLVVLNKTDLATADELASARAWAASHARGAPRLETVESRVALSGLVARPHHGVPHVHDAECGHEHDHAQHATQFESVAFRPSAAWSVEALRERLAALPGGVLRMKGIVRRDDGRFTELQYAGRHASLRPAEAAPEGGPMLVAIGLRGELPSAALRVHFGAQADAAA
ncbi:CobW family GTP-binding protein [Piscinibacter sp.]|uniref:CobW family GTP-binding protein n=1 Tax=Piscinibacter sp. TaxID=1903157 RepID=UPI00378366D7